MLRRLRYALAVWREGSFVQAAEQMNVSQPAISSQVRQLEEELGFLLFRRTGHGVEITDIGRTFLIQAEQVHFASIRLMDMARQLRGGPAGSFALGISSGVARLLVPKIMTAVRSRKPQVRLEITTTTTRRINQLLLDDRLDLGITVETNPKVFPRELASEPILQDAMVLIVSKTHPLAARKSIDVGMLASERLIINELSVGYGEIVLSMFSNLGIQPNIVAICDNVETLKAMVRADAGIALVPQFSVALDANEGNLQMLTVRPTRLMHVMLIHRAHELSATVETYTKLIRDSLLSPTPLKGKL